MSKTVGILIGTRPEVIKMVPVIIECRKHYKTIVISSGQQRELLEQALSSFDINPDFSFDIMTKNQTPDMVISSIFDKMTLLKNEISLDLLLIHGDTATAFAGANWAFLNKIPVGHIEAGLRTYNLFHPWPEEAFRQIIDRISTFCFAPTEFSKINLINENIPKDNIYVTGNTVIDSILLFQNKIPTLTEVFKKNCVKISDDFILVTLHRRENHNNLDIVLDSLLEITNIYNNLNIIFPVHPNPNIREPIIKKLSNSKNIYIINPLDYFDFICLLKNSNFIISDSGGVQEEASFFQKNVILLRETTERQEGVDAGFTVLTGCNKIKILKEVKRLKSNNNIIFKNKYPFGRGDSSVQIFKIINKNPIFNIA